MFRNTWNIVIEWFKDRSERSRLVRNFNQASRDAFVSGVAPTLLSGRSLSKEEMIFIGNVILADTELVRRLVVLGWDTLEVHDDVGRYGCRWKLIDYAKIGLMLDK